MNVSVRILSFDNSLLSELQNRFSGIFRERMRLFSITAMPLLMSYGLIVDPGFFGKDRLAYIPEHYEYHWFSVFVENFGVAPVIAIALALLTLVFFLVRLVIRTIKKRTVSDKMSKNK